MRLPNVRDVSPQRNKLIKSTYHDETNKRGHDSQMVRAKENLKMSYGGSSQRQSSCTNPRTEALPQSRHWAWAGTLRVYQRVSSCLNRESLIWGKTHRRAIKDKTIAITPRGDTLIFSSYVGSDPASTVHPQKISGIPSTPKNYLKFWNFGNSKKYPPFLALTLRKDPKMHRNGP